MSNFNSSPSLTEVTFSGNRATSYGGGMLNSESSPSITNVTFVGNSALNDGGGMYNQDSSPTLTNVIFSGNAAEDNGGGMFNYSHSGLSNPMLTNVTFSGNSAGEYGGGIYNFQASSPTIANTILWGNSAGFSHPQIGNDETSSPSIYYSDVQGGCEAIPGNDCSGGGNIDADPLFVRDPQPGPDGAWGTADDDYGNLRLQNGSPVVDAGDNTAPGLVGITTDLGDKPRFYDVPEIADTGVGPPPVVDMGAYEKQANDAPVISSLPNVIVDETTSLPVEIDLWPYAEDAENPYSELPFTIEGSPPPRAGITLTDNRFLNVGPGFDWCGYIDVTVRVTDPGGLWDEDTLRVAVTWVCLGPLPVEDQSAPQDQSITLDLTEFEPQVGDGTGMVWYVTGEDHCMVSGERSQDDMLTFTPQPGFIGSDTVTLRMTYPYGGEARQELTLTWWIVETPEHGFRSYLPVVTGGN
jgi:hypothetical protein